MAAQDDDISIPANQWTEITAGNVTAIRVQNIGGNPVRLRAAVGQTEPTTIRGGVVLERGEYLGAETTLAEWHPSVVSGNRVYAFAPSGATVLTVSHA
jgi:hypothetical protein